MAANSAHNFSIEADSSYYSADEILIRFQADFNLNNQDLLHSGNAALDSLLAAFGVYQVMPLFPTNLRPPAANNSGEIEQIYCFRFAEPKDIKNLVNVFKAQKIVDIAEPNYFYYLEDTSSPVFSNLDRIQLRQAARLMNFSNPVTVALIDAGFDKQIKSSKLLWKNAIEKANSQDDDGNGYIDDLCAYDFANLEEFSFSSETFKSEHQKSLASDVINGVVARAGRNKNIQKIKFMLLKAGRQHGSNKRIFKAFDITRAIVYAADNYAAIINFPAWGKFPSEILKQAINYAKKKNCTFIAAAGENINEPVYPAAFDNVVAVAALDTNDIKLDGANYGEWVKATAPGFLRQTFADSNANLMSPSVIAAAHVAGVAGLLLASEKGINSDSLIKRLLFSSDNIYDRNPDFSGQLGAGRINAFRTLSGQQKPSIIIQHIHFQHSSRANQNDTLSLCFTLKNLSFPAENISVILASNNQQLQFIKKDYFLARLNFQAEYKNENNPFKILLDDETNAANNSQITISITAANNFSLNKTINLPYQLPPPRDVRILKNNPVTLSWSKLENFIGCNIYRSDGPKKVFRKLNEIPISNSEFIDSQLQPNWKYFYYLTVLDSAGIESSPSIIDSVWFELDPQVQFTPISDSLVLSDSILFQVKIHSIPDTTVNLFWRVNGAIAQTDSSTFVLQKSSPLLKGKDTIQVSLVESGGDTSAVKTWFIRQNKPIFKKVEYSTFPQADASIFVGDTLSFSIYLKSQSTDSVRYQWSLNDSLINSANESTFFYSPISAFSKYDTLRVHIATADTNLFHQWTINIQPAKNEKYNQLLFSPDSNVTLNCGDTLLLRIEPFSENLIYQWSRNGLRDSTALTNTYLFYAPIDTGEIAEITATVISTDSAFRSTKNWLITYALESTSFKDLIYFPASDTAIFEGDTLGLSVANFSAEDSVIDFYWKINNFSISSTKAASYFFTPDFSAAGLDTIALSFQIGDSLFTHEWIINIKNKNRRPQIIAALPPVDSMLIKSDSLLLKIQCRDDDGDLLNYKWLKNKNLVATATDSFFYYVENRLERTIPDTITVQVFDLDTVIFAQWILQPNTRKYEQKAAEKAIIFYPDSTSLLCQNDSLKFIVANLPDSSVLQWFVNDKPESTTDSMFVFFIPPARNPKDTVRVLILMPDTSISREWLVAYPNSFTEKERLKLTFFPNDTLVTFSERDSLTFLIKIEHSHFPDINIHWFVNHRLQESFEDTIFHFLPAFFSDRIDTVTALITHADTTIFFNWALELAEQHFLPAPHLIYPIAGNRISETEKLMWEIDSSLAEIERISGWKYVLQLSSDSLFGQIFSVDTCLNQALRLNKTHGFKKLSIGEAVYWRVKFFSQTEISEFARCRLPFFYYPTFAIVQSFSGTIAEEGILLSWMTAYEANCAGFNIYRKNTADGNFEKVNQQLITGQHNYSWLDKIPNAGMVLEYKLEEITITGRQIFHQTLNINMPTPMDFSLSQNFPNPFNSTTSFKYQIPKETHVLIEVYNILGKKVKTLVDQQQDAGIFNVYWDGIDDNRENVVSGIYFYIMSTENFHATQKMIVVR